MNKTKNFKIIYPLISAVLATVGTAALYLGMVVLWLAALLAANVFFAAGIVCGTEIKTVRRKNPLARFSEDEPEEEEARMFRVPMISVILAVVAAVLLGVVSRSAVMGLLVLFTWGGLGFPLAMSVLYRSEFALSLQTGLISSVVLTAIAGVIQIFISSPGNTFDPEHCFRWIGDTLKNAVASVLTEMQTLTESQSLALSDGTDLTALFQAISPEEAADAMVTAFLSLTPAMFAIVVLALLCIVWWGTKVALKKDTAAEIKYMGRLDGYVPSRVLSLVYLLFFLINIFAESGSGMQIAAMNVVYVVSSVLTFAGFSLVLYIINTRAPSTAVRVLLIVVTVAVSLSSCGGSILLLLGLLSTGRDLRSTFGGGTLL